MAFDLKAATPDTSFSWATAFLFGADSQSATDPSIYAGSTLLADLARSTLAAGTLTADTPHIFSATFNNAAVTFTGKSNDFTDTASNAASLLERWRVGGTTVFSIGKAGTVNIVDFASFANLQNGGGVRSASGVVWGSTGSNQFAIGDSGGATRVFANVGSGGFLQVDAGHFIGWGTTAGQAYNAGDARLYRDGAGIVHLRNGANAQSLRWAHFYTNDANKQNGALRTAAGYIEIAAETAGTGADDIDVLLTPAGAGRARFGTHATIAAETVTGYITIKDAGGTERKIAVVS